LIAESVLIELPDVDTIYEDEEDDDVVETSILPLFDRNLSPYNIFDKDELEQSYEFVSIVNNSGVTLRFSFFKRERTF
jgi:hypothetical protein